MPSGYLASAQRVKNCPLNFKPGDRMFFQLPGMGKDESDHICALAVSDIIPVIHKMEKAGENVAKAIEIGRSAFCTGCKSINAFVEFQVARSSRAQLNADTGGIDDPKFLETLRQLKEFELFAPLPTRSLIRMLPCVKSRPTGEREIIVKKGERGDHLHLIVDGEVEVLTIDDKGNDTVLATLGKGEVFGEMSLLTGEPVAATIRSRGAKLLAIQKFDFERLLGANPALNLYFTRLLADRLRKTSRRFISEIEKGVLGYLNMIAPPELIQALEGTARSGVLSAREGEKTIEMYLHEGHLHRLTPGGKSPRDPEEAFFDFLQWRQGTFRFEPGVRDEPRSFFKETTALLLEGMRRADEASAPNG